MLHTALQIIRSDVAVGTGFPPIELLLGRKVIYPIEIDKKDFDITGVVVLNLEDIT